MFPTFENTEEEESSERWAISNLTDAVLNETLLWTGNALMNTKEDEIITSKISSFSNLPLSVWPVVLTKASKIDYLRPDGTPTAIYHLL